MDVINKVCLESNEDVKHKIYFLKDGAFQSLTMAEFDRQANVIAWHLRELGLGRGHRVGIMATNSIEWALLDVAVLKLGGVVAGLEVGRFDPRETIERYGLERLFMECPPADDSRCLAIGKVSEWAASARAMPPLPKRKAYEPNESCAIKFTSGSTGPPKAMEAKVAGINDSLNAVQQMFNHGAGDNILLFLRLALLQQRYWIYSGLTFGHDVTISSLQTVFELAQAAHPTVIMGVPGFFEDVQSQLKSSSNGRLEDLAERRSAIQTLFGGCVRYLWTGSAPARRALLDFYQDCGVPIYQGYGLNETCIVAKNYPGANRLGSVGRILPNVSVRFDDRGVLTVKSRNPIVTGYAWCDAGENDRMFLPSGEIVTQDVGYLDEDGYLYICGRADDLIVLSTGRNVLVNPVEEELRDDPNVHECLIYGHGKPFLTAVVSPFSETVDRASIENHIRAMNENRVPELNIRGLVISPVRFTVENGLLSSQLKPLRKEIFQYLASEIENVYQQAHNEVAWTGAYGS